MTSINPKTALITGSGVLGAYLSKVLIKRKYDVLVSSRYKKKIYKNYKYLKIQNKVKFLKLNVLSKKNISSLLKRYNPKLIFYLSGQSSLVKSIYLKKSTYNSHFLGAKNFLEIIKSKKLNTKFFKSNSGYIFSPNKGVITIKSKLKKTKNPYIRDQINSYKLVKKFRNLGLKCYSIIFLQVESPLRKNDFLIKKICSNANKRKSILVGNINTIRDYSWAPEIMNGVYYLTYLPPMDLILSSGRGMSGKSILKYAYRKKNLDYRKFYKIDKKLKRDKEVIKLVGSLKNTNILYKKFNWRPKIFGKKIIVKMINSIR